MKKLLLIAAVIFGLVTLNARIDSTRQCGCAEDCWCKQPGLRHFRWLIPYWHKTGST
jgi:hypothetical protein